MHVYVESPFIRYRLPSCFAVGNSFDEAYETSDFEEDGGDFHGSSAAAADVPREVAQRLEVAFRRLTWARQSPSLMKRFLTKKVFERLKGEGQRCNHGMA